MKKYIILFDNSYSYTDFLLWKNIYSKYMPQKPSLKVLEVGSAPGSFLIELNKRFKYIPYGVENSSEGFLLNKKLFNLNQINQKNIIYANFFSKDFQEQYKNNFDIVISRGFIEHFTNVRYVILNHINVLKRGGLLFIIIPNLNGFNNKLMKFFNQDIIMKHNLNIMNISNFSIIFKNFKLKKLFCNYFGTFSFGLFFTKNNRSKKLILNIAKRLQYFLDLLLLLLLKDRGYETKTFSPFLIYIGVKE